MWASLGIQMQYSVPYTPQQNGLVQSKNISLKEMDTCLIEEINIPSYLLAEAMNFASYIHNRIPNKLVIGVTPFETLMGHKLNVSHQRVFGSKAWARIPSNKRKSFQPRSSECISWDMQINAKYYKFMEIKNIIFFIAQSVQFKEDPLHDPQLYEPGRYKCSIYYICM